LDKEKVATKIVLGKKTSAKKALDKIACSTRKEQLNIAQKMRLFF